MVELLQDYQLAVLVALVLQHFLDGNDLVGFIHFGFIHHTK
jgi:hypothetical protein